MPLWFINMSQKNKVHYIAATGKDSEKLLCGYFFRFDDFETDTLMKMMAGFLLADHC